jgi:hypothetical protein
VNCEISPEVRLKHRLRAAYSVPAGQETKAMDFTLKMTFTGLCAFVPNTSGQQMRVLLIDGQDPRDTHGGEAHFPALVFDKASWVDDGKPNRKPEIRFFEGDDERGVILLDEEDLVVSQGGDPLSFENEDLEECPQGTRDHFSWVARIPRIAEASKKVHPDCLVPAGGSVRVHKHLIGRLALERGHLITSGLTEAEKDVPLRWKFRPDLPLISAIFQLRRQQALAEEVEWTLDIKDETEIALSSKRFNKVATELPPLRLAPMEGKVKVDIRNLPLPDVLRARPEDIPNQREKESHFEHYYRISNEDPGDLFRRIPFVDESCNSGGPITASNPKCPPSQFDPDPNA